jgi:signal transduction histidine kinase
MHRGQITVHSRVGQGTTFTVALPQRLPREPDALKISAGSIE